MPIFKVWSHNREKKAFVAVTEENNVYNNLILQASFKLDIDGSTLVLESDGTPIDDDEILLAVKQETLILLQRKEVWTPANVVLNCNNTFTTIPSTVTVSSTDIEQNSILNLSPEESTSDAQENNPDAASNGTINIEVVDFNLEYLWSSFIIPWEKIPQDMINMCERGIRNKYAITEIVHIIVNEMRQIRELIPSKAFKIVAYKMVDKYPAVFRDVDDDGVVLGDGVCSLKAKLQERYFYLRRPHKRSAPSSNPSTPPKFAKMRRNSMAGCSHWAPPPLEESPETSISLKEKINSSDVTDNEFDNLMEKTYPEQRSFINNDVNPPNVTEIKSEWPVLLTQKGLKWHFKKLTDVDIDNLSRSIQNKKDKLIQFGLKQKIILPSDVNRKSSEELCLEVFAKYLKEDLGIFLYQLLENEDTNIRDAIQVNEPCIVKFENVTNYCVYLEKQELNSLPTLTEALDFCFGLYFVFNFQYPKKISTFLEMLQRYCLKIHPDSGTKSKKLSMSKKKVISFMNKLRDI